MVQRSSKISVPLKVRNTLKLEIGEIVAWAEEDGRIIISKIKLQDPFQSDKG